MPRLNYLSLSEVAWNGQPIQELREALGVVQPQEESVFAQSADLATKIGAHPEKDRVIADILHASPSLLYNIPSASSSDDVLPALLSLQEQPQH